MIRPSRARFLMEERPEPLAVSLPLPEADAFELYRRLTVSGRPSFLLESGKGGEGIARYSFLGSDPYLVLSGKGSGYTLCSRDRTTTHEGNPFTALADLMRASRMPRPEGLPPFFGGAVGYLSYDAVRRFERLPKLATDDLRIPDLQFAFIDLLASLDHQERTLHLIFAPPMERLLGEPREKLYREGCDRLAELEARLSVPAPNLDEPTLGACASAPGQSRAEYMARVGQVQDYIRTGDIYRPTCRIASRSICRRAGQRRNKELRSIGDSGRSTLRRSPGFSRSTTSVWSVLRPNGWSACTVDKRTPVPSPAPGRAERRWPRTVGWRKNY